MLCICVGYLHTFLLLMSACTVTQCVYVSLSAGRHAVTLSGTFRVYVTLWGYAVFHGCKITHFGECVYQLCHDIDHTHAVVQTSQTMHIHTIKQTVSISTKYSVS